MNSFSVRTVLTGLFLLFSVSTASALDKQNAQSQSSGEVIGRIQIPAINVDLEIREGIAKSVIDQGVAHWAGSAMPGQPGNMILAGHRVLRRGRAPFERLGELRNDDEIFVSGRDGTKVLYKVTTDPYIIIDSRDRSILTEDHPETYRLTIFTCHPKGSNKKRLVIFAAHAPSAQLVD